MRTDIWRMFFLCAPRRCFCLRIVQIIIQHHVEQGVSQLSAHMRGRQEEREGGEKEEGCKEALLQVAQSDNGCFDLCQTLFLMGSFLVQLSTLWLHMN